MTNPKSHQETEQIHSPNKREKLLASSAKVIRYINRIHNLHYELQCRFHGGYQSGAYLLLSPTGDKAVLKWSTSKQSSPDQVNEAAAAIKTARSFGWPTPDWLAWGITPSGYPYQVQEFIKGEHRKRVDVVLVREALRVVEMQKGRAPAGGRNWTEWDRQVLYEEGEEKHWFVKRVCEFSDSGGGLVELLKRITDPFRNVQVNEADLVHGDLHYGNILIQEDKIVGLVDAEMLGRGSRLHDVTILMVFGLLFDEHKDQEALELLIHYCRANAGPGEFEITLFTNLVAFLSVFTNGKHEKDVAEKLIDDARNLVLRLFGKD